MSRKLIEKARTRLAAERGCKSNQWGGRFSVALVYPNSYHNAMSNLGFLSVYQLLNSRDDILCERFFLPDAEDLEEHRKTGYPLFSLETGQHLVDFDVIAFSIPFENDYLNLPTIMELGHIPLFAEERAEGYPLVLCGGVCAFLNPEPLADIMDAFVVGEAEPILPQTLDVLVKDDIDRSQLLRELAAVPGIYIPSMCRVNYTEQGIVESLTPISGATLPVKRQWLQDLNSASSRSFILTEETEFSDMYLCEVSRGCSRGCRFCAAGYIYLPPRERSLQTLQKDVEEGLAQRDKIGLVAAAISDFSELPALEDLILKRGGKVSVASLRLDALNEAAVAALKKSGHRTVALAPEAGSQRMRDLINKGIDRTQILNAVRLLAEGGIPNLKFYFLIGLPTEGQSDIDEMLDLVEEIRAVWLEEGKKKGRLGNITLSVNPFIPKPSSPLQWVGMDGEKSLKKKIAYIRKAIARMPNTEVFFESLRAAILQALLSRGDRRVGRLLPLLASGTGLKQACRQLDLDPSFYVTRERSEEEIFPWDVLDTGVSRKYLWEEYMRGLKGTLTPRCDLGCRHCGVCSFV